MTTRDELLAQKEDLERQLAALDQPKDTRTPAQQIADLLHAKSCHYNHIDQCGYNYGTWANNASDSTRQKYLRRAEELLARHPGNEAVIIDVLSYVGAV